MNYTIKEFRMIKIDALKHHPMVPEHESVSAKMDMKMMTLSVRSVGVLIPVIIDADDQVIDGWLRIRAAEAAGLQEVPALVVETGDARITHAVMDVGSWKNHEVQG